MSQNLRASIIEASANVVLGYGLAVALQLMVFPAIGLHPSFSQSLKIGLSFTVTSVLRSYAIRRLFEGLRAGHAR